MMLRASGAAVLLSLVIGAAAVSAQSAPQPRAATGRNLFISPMGEPFRGDNRKDLLKTWFDRADANRDGVLTLTEMRADGDRFYAELNGNGDREIDPNELRNYETRIAPEIRVGVSSAPPPPGANENPNASKSKRESVRRGAGIYGLLATPNPVASADTNFDRGISAQEFDRVARERFNALDANRDGRLALAELPALPNRPTRGWTEQEANPTFDIPRVR